jgi:steroid delta-isomerase-like uncharacterized protein
MPTPKELAEAGWNAWFRHDLDAVLENYAEDAEVILPGAPPIKGKEAIRQAWELFSTAIPDERALEMRFIADGNTVVTEWKTTGTHAGPLAAPNGEMIPPTGKTITQNGTTVFDFEGGKLKRQVFYWDNADFLQQMGLMPSPEQAGAAR